MQPYLSVLVPVYNVEAYLERCLDSILTQTYRNLDIVLVDDGSSDHSGALCDAYAQKDSRIHVVHKRNGGLVSARKAGLLHAQSKADYVTFVDSDDWLEPNAYERMISVMVREQVQCVIADHYEDVGGNFSVKKSAYAAGRYAGERLEKDFYPTMMGGNPFFSWGIFPSLCNKIFQKSLLRDVLLHEDESIVMGEDAAVVFPSLLRAESLYIMHEAFYHYVQKTQSMVKNVYDSEREKKQYLALYRYVAKNIPAYMLERWQAHMLFNMVQRADHLYEGFYNLPYLFPFSHVKRGMSIILYGAGTYGQRVWNTVRKSGFVRVVGWADRNAEEIVKLGLPVICPEDIQKLPCDDIVITIAMGQPRQAAAKELKTMYPHKRIHVWDERLIFSDETKKAFRLIE
jgi:glycosyltransferase involved in cell wall biosynthesis